MLGFFVGGSLDGKVLELPNRIHEWRVIPRMNGVDERYERFRVCFFGVEVSLYALDGKIDVAIVKLFSAYSKNFSEALKERWYSETHI